MGNEKKLDLYGTVSDNEIDMITEERINETIRLTKMNIDIPNKISYLTNLK